mmetsp:Transcript_22825/g.57725  ORF Transcript_22825/g.57725 Transcript_22825/m.57725 type:complete len:125 (+) Transcript_22825:2002-2376(+)
MTGTDPSFSDFLQKVPTCVPGSGAGSSSVINKSVTSAGAATSDVVGIGAGLRKKPKKTGFHDLATGQVDEDGATQLLVQQGHNHKAKGKGAHMKTVFGSFGDFFSCCGSRGSSGSGSASASASP